MGSVVKVIGSPGRWFSLLGNGLQRLKSEKLLCDVSLVSRDGHEVEVHSAVLAAASPVLESILKTRASSGEDKPDDKKVVIDDVMSGDVLTCVVDFVYTGSCDVTETQLDELCSTAGALKMSLLQEKCRRKLDGEDPDSENNNNNMKESDRSDEERMEEGAKSPASDSAKDRLRQALKRKLGTVRARVQYNFAP